VLYGRPPIPFQTLNFRRGPEQATHSDAIHFYSISHRYMCGVWIALEDVDADNGPLPYYPGSHKIRDFFMHDLGLPSDRDHYGHYEQFIGLLAGTSGSERVEVTLRKGQAVNWGSNLFHGGAPIRDPSRTRHRQVTHDDFPNCVYYLPLLSNPYLGVTQRREVIDIRTGRFVPHRYGGEEVPLPEDTIAWRYPRPLPDFVTGAP